MLWAGKDYPGGLTQVREKAKKQFFAMRDERDPEAIQKAIAKGEYILSEIEAMNSFHKYRHLRRSYYDPLDD